MLQAPLLDGFSLDPFSLFDDGFSSSVVGVSRRHIVEASVGWVNDQLLSGVAVTLCVLAVAFVGFAMLSGRLPVRTGFSVMLGCFVLLGAPVIAAGLMERASEGESVVAEAPEYSAEYPRSDLEVREPDPYGGASLRR